MLNSLAKISMHILVAIMRISKKFCWLILVDKMLCGRYLVDIRSFFWRSIFNKTPVAGLQLYFWSISSQMHVFEL